MSQTQPAKSLPGREYETIYVLRPETARDNAERIAKRIEEVVGREGGRLTRVENWGRRQTAFPVAKTRRALYVYVRYVGGGVLVSELERSLRMQDDVIKYQTVRIRDDVDLSTLAVNPEDVQFEMAELPADEEPEQTLARRLGLEEGARDRDLDDRSGGPAQTDLRGDAEDGIDTEDEPEEDLP